MQSASSQSTVPSQPSLCVPQSPSQTSSALSGGQTTSSHLLALQTEDASPHVSSSLFRNNSFTSYAEPEGGAAIYIGPGSAPRIVGNTFEENNTLGFAQGGAIYVDFAMPVIQDNLFRNNSGTYGGAEEEEESREGSGPDGIDGPGVRGAGRRDQQPGLQAFFAVGSDHRFQRRRVHPEPLVHRHDAFPDATQSGHVQGGADTVVRLFGHVNAGLRYGGMVDAVRVPRRDQGR